MINVVIIDEKDNVVVVIEVIVKGSEISFKLKDKIVKMIIVLDDIIIYYKLVIKDMVKGDKVIKYGEYIGEVN